MITYGWGDDDDAGQATRISRRLVPVWRPCAGDDGTRPVAGIDARLRGRGRADGGPLHRAQLVAAVLSGVLCFGAATAVAEFLQRLAAAQPAICWTVIRVFASSACDRHHKLRGDGPPVVQAGHLACPLH